MSMVQEMGHEPWISQRHCLDIWAPAKSELSTPGFKLFGLLVPFASTWACFVACSKSAVCAPFKPIIIVWHVFVI
jgi:hypothetical protein